MLATNPGTLLVRRTIYCFEVFLRFIVQLLGLCFQFLKSPFGVNEDGIFGDITDVEPLLELLRSPRYALSEAFNTHGTNVPRWQEVY